ncbi:MAG TPA: mechanosensitive ion channel domain-containing protein [Gemmatimonadales bacterium]|nr:mechanosensitive ion channel domain-containing protein [Gemmatimonadales bacterium]
MAWQRGHRGALPADPADSVPQAPAVVLDGTVLFRVTEQIGPYSRVDRAADVSRVLDSLSRNPPPGGFTVMATDGAGYSDLAIGPLVLHRIVDADTAGTGLSRPALAHAYERVLSEALTRASTRRRNEVVDRQVAIAGGFTLLLLLALLIGGRLVARTQRRLERLRDDTMEWEAIRHLEVVRHISIIDTLLDLLRVLRYVAVVLLVMIYVPTVLGIFPATAPLARQVATITLDPILAAGRALLNYLPRLLVVVLVLVLMRYVAKLASLGFRAIGEGQVKVRSFPAEWAQPTSLLVRGFLVAVTFALIFPYLPGARSDGVKGVTIFIGLLLSWGSSSAVTNLIAGVVLTYTRAFKVGDRVAIAGTVGDVVERSLLVTRVRTTKNVDVTIPNGVVLSTNMENYSTAAVGRGLVLHVTLTLSFDSDWRDVHRVLVEAALATPRILPTPAPYVLQTAIGDFAVAYELNAYTDHPSEMDLTQSALHASILDACSRAGLELVTPTVTAYRRHPAFRPVEASQAGALNGGGQI